MEAEMENSFYILMDMIIIAFGAYVIYQYAVMVKTGKIQQNMLLPKDINVKKCKDPQGFIKYMGMKQLLFGLATLLCGGIGLVQDYTGTANQAAYLLTIGVFVAFTVWYVVAMKKAIKQFWGK